MRFLITLGFHAGLRVGLLTGLFVCVTGGWRDGLYSGICATCLCAILMVISGSLYTLMPRLKQGVGRDA
jgi:hypothetical protein